MKGLTLSFSGKLSLGSAKVVAQIPQSLTKLQNEQQILFFLQSRTVIEMGTTSQLRTFNDSEFLSEKLDNCICFLKLAEFKIQYCSQRICHEFIVQLFLCNALFVFTNNKQKSVFSGFLTLKFFIRECELPRDPTPSPTFSSFQMSHDFRTPLNIFQKIHLV